MIFERPEYVLILDDDEEWRQILSDIVKEVGFQPVVVNSLRLARDALKTQRFSLILLDLLLHKNKNALAQGAWLLEDVAAQYRGLNRGPRVIVISGSTHSGHVIEKISHYTKEGIIAAFFFKETLDENKLREELLNIFNQTGDGMMDPSLLAMLALSAGVPFFTSVGETSGTIIGQYLGNQTRIILNRIFKGKIASPDDLLEDRLKAITAEAISAVTLQEKTTLTKEAERSLKTLMNSDHFSVDDLDDFYNELGVHTETGMFPVQNQDYLRGTGHRKNRANYLASWAFRHNKMGELFVMIQNEKPFLFDTA